MLIWSMIIPRNILECFSMGFEGSLLVPIPIPGPCCRGCWETSLRPLRTFPEHCFIGCSTIPWRYTAKIHRCWDHNINFFHEFSMHDLRWLLNFFHECSMHALWWLLIPLVHLSMMVADQASGMVWSDFLFQVRNFDESSLNVGAGISPAVGFF